MSEDWNKYTKEEIQERLESNLEEALPTSAEPGDLVTAQLEAEAATLAELQEVAMEKVYKSAYLEDAEGRELEKLAGNIGLSRMEATGATGVAEFIRETVPDSTFTIQRGLRLQTEGSDPIEFETTEQNALYHIDSFETGDLTNWSGDESDFSVVSTGAIDGTYSLEVPAVADASITRNSQTYRVGTTFNGAIEPASDSTTSFRYGVQDDSNYYEAVIDEFASELKLRLVEDGTITETQSETVTVPADEVSHFEIEWALYGDSALHLYETEQQDAEIGSVTLSEHVEWSEGELSVRSLDDNATALLETLGTTKATANIQATDTGAETNVSPNSIRVLPDGATGVEEITNPVSTGDVSFLNTNYSPYSLGEDREDDEALRERAFENSSIGGAATARSIETELRRVEGVQSLTLYRNRKENAVDGLPTHSFEAVVYGGENADIAQAIFDTAAIDSTDHGGAHGTEVTYDVESDVTKDVDTIHWSRPPEVNLNITVDLIVDENYVGDAEIQSIIANYIGGTDTDGSQVGGLDVGEDVYEAVLKGKVVGPDTTGVWEVDSLTIDRDNDGTDDTTTTASDADVLAIATNEVPLTNARDGSITVNKTQR